MRIINMEKNRTGINMEIITLGCGSGGEKSSQLIKELFINKFDNEILNQMNDSAIIDINNSRIAITTDTFVVSPLFFEGGNIGKLAVCGTINDLAMVGAKPLALTCGFVIEEGMNYKELENIVESMRDTCIEAGVEFVSGDTKVVERGSCDKLFINTSGIGIVGSGINIAGNNARVGDKIIVSGNIGDHEAAVMIARGQYGLESDIKSDVSPLNIIIGDILKISKNIRVLRDPTRGGLATTLNEIAEQSNVEIEIVENLLPIDRRVCGLCDILGLDPMYMANEGKFIAIVPDDECEKILSVIKENKYGINARIIGAVKKDYIDGRVYLLSKNGSSRIINKLTGDFLPRIC